jgi:hypothetical protein
MKKILFASILAFAGAAQANQFLITQDEAKGGAQRFSIDFVSNGDAVDLVARVNIADSEKAKVNYSACGKGAPEGFQAICSVAKGKLIVQLIGDGVKRLPKGQVSLGVYSVSYADAKARQLSFAENDVSAADASMISSKAEVQ